MSPLRLLLLLLCAVPALTVAQAPRFHVLAFYTAKNDPAHISFVHEANRWFPLMAKEYHFAYDSTNDWTRLNPAVLSHYQVVIFLDTRPEAAGQREAFRDYMEHGGAWMGFHFSGFALTPSDVPQNWDWYHNTFLGSGSYVSNTWRPTSAVLRVEDPHHPVTGHLPPTFRSTPNEWYRWSNDLRDNPDIDILLSIDSSSFPLGTGPKPSEIWHGGYYPVVWTNRNYRMVYFNMGHNDMDYEHHTNRELSQTFSDSLEDRLILNALRWLGDGSLPSATELQPWGDVGGMRIDGQLMDIRTGVRVVGADGRTSALGKERQRPRYVRDGNRQTVYTRIDSLYFRITTEDTGPGEATFRVRVEARADDTLKGIYVDVSGGPGQSLLLASGVVRKGDTAEVSVRLHAGGPVDRRPVHVTVDPAHPGRPFAGLGGNFRIQDPKTDPEVIDYNLEHLRVAWARVEMPWRFWQPGEGDDPLDSARAGKLHPFVRRAMEMAKTLSEKGIPLILTTWTAPDWAIVGPVRFRPLDGVWGNPLRPGKMPEVYRSIADYIQFLRDGYGVAVDFFSLNESDLGINIRMTGEEHDAFIKGLGAYFVSRGLKTRLLLGDNSDATTYRFIDPALHDPAALPYIGAVSFHSWRGWDTATLEHWTDASRAIDRPLIIAEGSIDAQAWGYPAIFQEPSYALREIELYTRLLAICRPLSILQWQFTSDYSLLKGGGVFGEPGPLSPTQRFWNLKQMSLTPAGLKALPAKCDRPGVTCAALGDANGFVLHLVNDGAARKAVVTGIPRAVRALQVYTTNAVSYLHEGPVVPVKEGRATLYMDADSYVTLINSASGQ